MLSQQPTQTICELNNVSQVENCRHCGSKLLGAAEREVGFCCHGCAGVFRVLNELGLEKFYTLRESGAAWQATSLENISASYGYMDQPEFVAEYTRVDSSGLSVLKFKLNTMHCAACIWLLEKTPEILEGLSSVRVNLAAQEATLKIDLNVCRLSQAAELFNSLGYPPRPMSLNAEQESMANDYADKRIALQLGLAALCATNVMMLYVGRYAGLFYGIEQGYDRLFSWVSFVLSIPVVFYSAQPFYKSSLAGLKLGRLHMDLSISLAIVLGFAASAVNTIAGRGENYFDTVTALVFFLLCGRWIQARALRKVGQESSIYQSLTPLTARRQLVSGEFEDTFVGSLHRGDIIKVCAAEVLPADGRIVSGRSHIDFSILTGESDPIRVAKGDIVFAGTKCVGDSIEVEIEAVSTATRLGRLLADVDSGRNQRGEIYRFTDRVGAYFVVGVLSFVALTFLFYVPLGGWVAFDRILALLVVSCPCALGIAVPIMWALSAASASRQGILIRSLDALERASQVKTVLFDKTGTITVGKPQVIDAYIEPTAQLTKHDILSALYAIEQNVSHPVAAALNQYALTEIADSLSREQSMLSSEVLPGKGIKAEFTESGLWQVGSQNWLSLATRSTAMSDFIGRANAANLSTTLLVNQGQVVAALSLDDQIRSEAKLALAKIKQSGRKVGILSGDDKRVVAKVANQIELSQADALGELSPEAKALVLRSVTSAAFVGDGVNDAAALASADLGIAISGGAEVCLRVSDIFLTRPDLNLILLLFQGAKRTLQLVKFSLAISLVYNITAGAAAILGLISPLAAALIMPASSLSVIGLALLYPTFKSNKTGSAAANDSTLKLAGVHI